jgi:peptide-methionine (S)-S-oxide reductase
MQEKNPSSTATFAAGCFWGVEDIFMQMPGVLQTTAGYTGGTLESPSYHVVCTGTTGHAEAVLIEFDPAVITYEQLLDVFWDNHNPTTVDRQGPDIGSEYRSAIFYHDEEQRLAAEASVKILTEAGRWKKPIVTQIVQAETFWPAEDYHQQYHMKNGGSCRY